MTGKALPRFITSIVIPGFLLGATTISALAQTPNPTPTRTTIPTSPTLRDDIADLWQAHRLSLISAGLLVLLGGGGYVGVLWLRPLLLLKFPSTDIPTPWEKFQVRLSVIRWLKYRDRVLDAWVEQHWQTAQTAFLKLPTVDDRAIHIPLAVQLDKDKISDLTAQHLAPTFQKNQAVLLICGEGGAGKTSLACQIAQWGLSQQLRPHRMIPILIEEELNKEQDGKALTSKIQGLLTKLTDQADPIELELLAKLLQRQRVLVIVDHLSEMGEATRSQIKLDQPHFPARALIVTSRLEEALGRVPKTVVKPLQVEANRLWPFMSAYLEAKGKQDLFEDDDYSDGGDRLRRMAGERSITVLLARMYIDQMIREREGAGGISPDSVPKLMLSYLNQLNLNIAEGKRENSEVQRDAKRVAWTCLEQTYRPVWIKRAEAIAALETVEDGTPAKDRLHYLEQRLQLLQTPEPGDSTRIILDPLAEYLAAAYLVEQACQQANPIATWQRLFADIDQKLAKENETPDIIRGFLLAVRDCCLDDVNNPSIPNDLPDQLARKANLDPDELRRMQEHRRIRRLISQLSVPEEGDRLDAVTKLSQCGAAAKRAEPNLVGMLENRSNQTLAARQAAARALGTLGIGEAALLTILQDTEEDSTLRRSAAEALGQMKAGRATLLQILQADEQPLTLRQGTARALGLIGAPSGEAVPMLIPRLRDGEVITEVKAIRVWRETLPQYLSLELVAVPGGEFLMGSPPDEAGRDWYTRSYPDTEGLDVEAQHPVTIQPFWMGQHPITQAQWRAVASLPAINQELELNPSSFKGDVGVASQNENRPVEQVTWYDAVEFCDRLSKYTGKTYRLPSEAEWEYACRAGTIDPFFTGDTLSTQIANYDGNYTYGTGEKGIYQEQTAVVGSFGANVFGLADMHGNVYDWCLDHWHPRYDGAPDDGSAWVTEGDDRYRIVRGGSWYGNPRYCRSAFRYRVFPVNRFSSVGFRVVCVAPWT